MEKELAVDVPRHKGGGKVGGGRKLTYDHEIEERVVVFVIEKREHQLPVSRDSVRRYILALTEEKYQSSRKSVGPPDISGKIVLGPMTIPRNSDRMSGVVFAPKI